MKAGRVCVALALAMVAGYAQSSFDAEKARVLSLENAWNQAEKNKDRKAVDALLAPTFAYTDSDGSFMSKEQYPRKHHGGQLSSRSDRE